MTITVALDSMPRTIYGAPQSTVLVRLLDQSTTTNGVIDAWRWWLNNPQVFTTDNSGMNLLITNAELWFAVGDTVILSSTGILPTGLSGLSTAYYVKTVFFGGIQLSLTAGGNVVTYTVGSGSGVQLVQMGSNLQNPTLPIRNLGGSPIGVTLSVNDSGGTGWTTLTENNQIIVQTGYYAPPSQLSAYGNISIFVYERSLQTSPKSTCICRGPTAACNFFFQNLWMEGAITKAGRATFDIVNGGNATANEIDLFESNSVGTYKNIAVVAGYDVIWSGKITVATKELKSQPGAAKQRAIYHCQADSDIYKLQDWNIVTPTPVIGQTPGQIVNDILIPNTGEPNFAGGYRGGFIDVSGLPLQMTLANTDKYSLFTQLMATVDFDWQTRMETMVFQYVSFDGSGTVTIPSAGLTAGALVGQWLLFPTNYCLMGGSSNQNKSGILAWGQITANTGTTITATLTNAAAVPLSNDTCLIVNIPRLDFSSDLTEPTPVRTFTNNVDSVQFTGSDDKTNLFTVVCVKGATNIPVYAVNAPFGIPNQIAVSISAKDAWDPVAGFFKNSSFVTHQTDGFIYSYAAGSDTLVLIGQNYALRSGDTIWIKGYMVNGAGIPQFAHTISGTPTTQTQSDGTPTTTITLAAGNEPAANVVKYSMVIGAKTYLNNTANLSTGPLNIGIEKRFFTTGGIDPVYGPYLTMSSFGTNISVHYPGCLVSTQTYAQTSPMPGSPVQMYGVITNTVTVSTNTTLPDLEVAACNMLIQGCQYYQKFTLLVGYYNYTINRVRDGAQLMTYAFIREGEQVSIVPYTGATAINMQVILWDFDANTMQVSLTLGDYVHNVYNSIAKSLAPTQNALN
jgi:hypothetical protein